jgi:hypothetical protein
MIEDNMEGEAIIKVINCLALSLLHVFCVLCAVEAKNISNIFYCFYLFSWYNEAQCLYRLCLSFGETQKLPACGSQYVLDSAGPVGVGILVQHDNPLRTLWDTSCQWLYKSWIIPY